jgi:hypothetical protein
VRFRAKIQSYFVSLLACCSSSIVSKQNAHIWAQDSGSQAAWAISLYQWLNKKRRYDTAQHIKQKTSSNYYLVARCHKESRSSVTLHRERALGCIAIVRYGVDDRDQCGIVKLSKRFHKHCSWSNIMADTARAHTLTITPFKQNGPFTFLLAITLTILAGCKQKRKMDWKRCLMGKRTVWQLSV